MAQSVDAITGNTKKKKKKKQAASPDIEAIRQEAFELNQANKSAAERLATMPVSFVKDAPVTAYRMTYSNTPNREMTNIGGGLQNTWNWLMSNNTFGGERGSLAVARTRALALANPKDRETALKFLRTLHSMPEEKQAMYLSIVRGQLQNKGIMHETQVPLSIEAKDAGSARFAQIVQELFPEVEVDLGPQSGFGGVLHDINMGIGEAWDQTGAGVLKGAGEFVEGIPVVGGPIVGGVQEAFARAGQAFGTGIDFLTAAPSVLAIAVSAAVRPDQTFSENFRNLAKTWREKPGFGVGNVAATLAGVKPTDPEYEDYEFFFGLVANFVVGRAAGRSFRGLREGRQRIVPLTQEIALERYGHIGRRIYNAAIKGRKEWMETRYGRAVVRRMLDVNRKFKGDQRVAAHIAANPELATAPRLVQKISRARSEGGIARLLDDQLNKGGDFGRAKRLKKELRKVTDEVAKAESPNLPEDAGRTQIVDMGDIEPVPQGNLPEGTQVRPTRLSDSAAEYYQLVDPDGNIINPSRMDEGLPTTPTGVNVGMGYVFRSKEAALKYVEAHKPGRVQRTLSEVTEPIEVRYEPSAYGEFVPASDKARGLYSEARALGQERVPIKVLNPEDLPRVGSADDIALLKARQHTIKAKLDKIGNVQPEYLIEWPRAAVVRGFLRRATRGAPLNKTERFIEAMYVKGKVKGLFEDLPNNVTFWNPFRDNAPADAFRRNAENMRKMLRLAGVDEATIRRHIDRLSKVDHPLDFNETITAMLEEIGESRVGKAAAKVDPALGQRIVRYSEATEEQRMFGTIHEPDSRGNMRPRSIVSEDVSPGVSRSLPSMPSELVDHITLPWVDRLVDATQMMNRAPGVVKLPMAVARVVSDTATTILKPAVLAVRLPAMILRIQIEQAARSAFLGIRPVIFPDGLNLFAGGIKLPMKDKRVLSQLFGETGFRLLYPNKRLAGTPLPNDINEMGLIWESFQDPTVESVRIPRDTSGYSPDGVQAPREVFRGVYNRMAMWHNDPLMRVLAGVGPDEFIKILDGPDSYIRHVYETQMKPFIDRDSKLTRNKWVKEKWQELQELTGGDANLIEGVASGRWVNRGKRRAAAIEETLGDELGPRYRRLLSEEQEVTKAYRTSRREGTREERRLLTRRRKELLDEIEGLEREARMGEDVAAELPDEFTGYTPRYRITSDTENTFVDGLERAWKDGEYTLPRTVQIQAKRGAAYERTWLETMEAGRQMMNKALYRPFRLATRADLAGTRGSMYRTIVADEFAALRASGMGRKQAFQVAAAEASRKTIDWMYDMSARTSAQRYMRNVFWFAPAWQEVMTTWAVTIPSRYYWPVGVGYLSNRFQLLVETLKQTGIIQKDSQGEERILVPVLGDLLEKISGSPMKRVVSFRPESINLVTQGLPGLSAQWNKVVGTLAKKDLGPFSAISEMLQPFGMESSFTPRALSLLFETTTGKPAPWDNASDGVQKQLHDLAFDNAMQQAFTKLSEEDVNPPNVNDYTYDQPKGPKGKYRTEKAARKAYEDAQVAFTTRWMRESERMHKFNSLMMFMGASISPVSLRVSDEYRESWNEFWTKMNGERDAEGNFNQRQLQMIDEWIAEHPGSVGYSVFRTYKGDKYTAPPQYSKNDNQFLNDLVLEERKVLEPEEYSTAVLAAQSWMFFRAKQKQELDNIGTTAPDLLRNKWDRAQVMARNDDEFKRYLGWNSEAKAYIEQKRKDALDKPGRTRLTFEAERLIEGRKFITLLAGHFSAYGVPSGEWKTIKRELGRLFGEQNPQFGEPRTEVEKGMRWYNDNVLQPYMDEAGPLYDAIRERRAKSQRADDLYDRLDKVTAKYSDRKFLRNPNDRRVYPSPEETFFGNRSPGDRTVTVLSWQADPPTFLSDFELTQAGFKPTKRTKDFLKAVETIDDAYYKAKKDVSANSREADALEARRQKLHQQAAKKTGQERMLRFVQATPAERLNMHNATGTENDAWKEVMGAVKRVKQEIEEEGYSIKGFSKRAVELKRWLYSGLRNIREKWEKEKDPYKRQQYIQFDRLMSRLALTLPPNKGETPDGAPLYEALFFGNFSWEFIPDEVAEVAG